MSKRAASLAEISSLKSEIIGRQDENSPYEPASTVRWKTRTADTMSAFSTLVQNADTLEGARKAHKGV